MPLDPHAQRFLLMTRAAARSETASIDERRAAFTALLRQAAPRRTVEAAVEEIRLPGPAGPLPCRLYGPPDAAGAVPGLVFFHGGGLTAGGLDSHDHVCRALAIGAGIRLVAVDYRLAPEHPFPAAFEDAAAALRAVGEEAGRLGIDPGRLGIGGDSAGGGLAAATARRAVPEAGFPPLALQLLICPVLDPAGGSGSHAAFATGHFLDAQAIRRDLDALGPEADPRDPRLTPLAAPDLAGLPPALVHVAEYDPVRDGGVTYAERLAAAGVPARLTIHPGLIHLFYGLGGIIPRGEVALAAIAAELGDALHGRTSPDRMAAWSAGSSAR